MRTENDWRLINQEGYLKGTALSWRLYIPAGAGNDHDHCEFCAEKFMAGGTYNTLAEGYSTQEGYRWICKTCFDDFVDLFGWHVV